MNNCMSRRNVFEVPALGVVFNELLRDPVFTGVSGAGSPNAGTLALDVSETEANVLVRASLPGFRKEDVHIEVNDGVLTITAERSEETETKNERFYRKERRSGTLTRKIVLPDSVSEGETKAELKDGVLTLTLPKTPERQPRKIQVS